MGEFIEKNNIDIKPELIESLQEANLQTSGITAGNISMLEHLTPVSNKYHVPQIISKVSSLLQDQQFVMVLSQIIS